MYNIFILLYIIQRYYIILFLFSLFLLCPFTLLIFYYFSLPPFLLAPIPAVKSDRRLDMRTTFLARPPFACMLFSYSMYTYNIIRASVAVFFISNGEHERLFFVRSLLFFACIIFKDN